MKKTVVVAGILFAAVQLAGCHTVNGTLMGAQQDTKAVEHAVEGKEHHCHKHHKKHHRHHGHHKHHAHHQAAAKKMDDASPVTQ